MANKFVPNPVGYHYVMDSNNEVWRQCELKGYELAMSASAQSGTTYRVDTIKGLNRVHTRVSTQTSRDYFRERHYHALSIALGALGGTVNAANSRGINRNSLMSRVSRVAGKKNRGWKALAGGYKSKGRR